MRPRDKLEAISAARCAFGRWQLDEASWSVGLKRLRAYCKEGDEDRDVCKNRPRHDKASHGADAFPTFTSSGYTPPSIRARFNRKMITASAAGMYDPLAAAMRRPLAFLTTFRKPKVGLGCDCIFSEGEGSWSTSHFSNYKQLPT